MPPYDQTKPQQQDLVREAAKEEVRDRAAAAAGVGVSPRPSTPVLAGAAVGRVYTPPCVVHGALRV